MAKLSPCKFLLVMTLALPHVIFCERSWTLVNVHDKKKAISNNIKLQEIVLTQNVFQALFDLFFKKVKRKPSSRGDSLICADSPSFDTDADLLWERQPLMVWQGLASSLTIIERDTNKEVWRKNFSPPRLSGKVRIDIKLQPGKNYEWKVIHAPDNEKLNPSISFRTLPHYQYKQISKELIRIEAKYGIPEEVIFQKAKYFAEKSMWGDVQNLLHQIPASSRYYPESSAILKKATERLSVCRQKVFERKTPETH
jgi:hypothetical protein